MEFDKKAGKVVFRDGYFESNEAFADCIGEMDALLCGKGETSDAR